MMFMRKAILKSASLASIKINVSSKRTHVKISPWRTLRSKRECYLDNTEKPYTDRHNPAEFMREHKKLKPWQRVIYKDEDGKYNDYVWHDGFVSKPQVARQTAMEKLSSLKDSLNQRGEARETIPYVPSPNVEEQIIKLFHISTKHISANGIVDNEFSLTLDNSSILAVDLNQNRTLKFDLITKCIKHFDHDLPCSYLNEMLTIGDLVNYFSTPVRGINPYDKLAKDESSLPPNLSMIQEPYRFDVENAEFFKGYNAYPGLVSVISGLRAKKKFPVLNQKEFQWPDV